MRLLTTIAATLVAGALLSILPAAADSDAPPPKPTPRFAPGKMLNAAAKPMGAGCLYPSPVLHDLDGDGTREMIIGDLRGYLTVVKRTAQGWGAESKLNGADGKPLKFRNW